MAKITYMNISEFSKHSGIKRANLIYYDNIGLLVPEHRSENNYRCYSQHQLKNAFIITSFRAVGISIEEIKAYTNERSPEKMVKLFEAQEKYLQEEITRLKHRKAMMKLQRFMVMETKELDIQKIHIIDREDEPMFIGEVIPSGMSEDRTMIEFYEDAEKHHIELSNPFGAIIDKSSLAYDEIADKIKQFYLKLPYHSTEKKPAGRYVVGFMYGDYGQSNELYKRLITFIKQHQLVICGDAYEEYPLHEVTTKDPNLYLIKIEIMVK